MAKNVHRVQKKQWKKWEVWGKRPQAMYNRLWSWLVPEVLPPLGVKLTQRQLNVLRANVCWLAADVEAMLCEDAFAKADRVIWRLNKR